MLFIYGFSTTLIYIPSIFFYSGLLRAKIDMEQAIIRFFRAYDLHISNDKNSSFPNGVSLYLLSFICQGI